TPPPSTLFPYTTLFRSVGVNAASLGPDNFLVNQAPSLSNYNTMTVSDGAMLPVGGLIQNSGTISLNSTGNETDLEIVSNTTLRRSEEHTSELQSLTNLL